METFVWNDNFVTGISIVDEEHQILVDLINKFGSLLAQNELVFEDIESVYEELTNYAKKHFKDEEEVMNNHGIDPRHIKQHHKQHVSFLNEVVSIHDSITPDTAVSLLKFLIAWLAYHILCTDQNMAKQIVSIQAGKKADVAYDENEEERDSKTEPLLAALNSLFEQVSSRNNELLELNQTLEAKVEERTSELTKANLQLEKIALTDVLTGLPNRRYCMQQFELQWNESVEKDTPLICLMVDADGFKEINDNYGHEAGDTVLKMLSRELGYAIRSDDIVYRLGGDEFLIICPNTPLNGGMHVAEITRKTINKLHISAGKGEWHGSISVGVAVRTPEMDNLDELIKAADDSVYLAKKAGKNCVKSIQTEK